MGDDRRDSEPRGVTGTLRSPDKCGVAPATRSAVVDVAFTNAPSTWTGGRGGVGGIEEAAFVVVESGRITFYVGLRAGAPLPPTGVADIEGLSFTLAPHVGSHVRRIALEKKRLPDDGVAERVWASVERITSMTVRSDSERSAASLQVASGSYAIALHRDHSHLLYEIDPHDDVLRQTSASLKVLRSQLGIASRASYVVAVTTPDRKGIDVPKDSRKLTLLEPAFLDREGAEFVLIGAGRARQPTTA
jgi:hypothetical protein